MGFNFAIIDAGGYIVQRHLRAIQDTGNHLVAAVDLKDSVWLLDQYSFNAKFFTEIEHFDRPLEKLRRDPDKRRIQYFPFTRQTICRMLTAGPALNPKIKVVNLVSVIIAPIIFLYQGVIGSALATIAPAAALHKTNGKARSKK